MYWLTPDQDIVDWDVNELDEKADEAHDEEADTGGPSDLHKFLTVRLCALFHQVHRVPRKLLKRFDQNLVESFLFCHLNRRS